MKNYPVSLEKAFLNRQFRPIRLSLLGMPANRTTILARKALFAVSTIFKDSNRVSSSILNQKSALVSINQQNDIVEPVDLRAPEFALKKPTPKIKLNKREKLRTFVFGGVIVASLVILTILLAPSVYYSFFPSDSIPIETDASGTPLGGSFTDGSIRSKVPAPEYDANLPEGNWLIIPKIGVNTDILESATPDESLNKGVWRVPDFGTVTDLSKPMILAAHRYGWKAWWENGNQYWRYHSFYLLPKLEQGDIVEVISDHRKYVYEIYAGEQGEKITDYNADLILYTCKFLDSPLRYFRYARLVDPNNPAAISSK